MSCSSGRLDWVVFEAASPNGYPQWIRDNTRDPRNTGLPLSPNPLNLDFNIPNFIFSNKVLTDQGYAFFRLALGCNLRVGNSIYTNSLALSAPVCVIIPGGKANNCGIGPGQPGEDQLIKWGIINPLIGMSKTQNVFDLIVIIADWILNIAGSLIILLIIYSGVRFLISRGNPGEIQKAKSILFWALVGFGVILIGKGFIYLIEGVLQGKIPIFP